MAQTKADRVKKNLIKIFNRLKSKQSKNKLVRKYVLAILATIISMIIAIIMVSKICESLLQNILTVAGIAGFAGLFVQYVLTYLQERTANKKYVVKMICRHSPFSESLANGLTRAYATNGSNYDFEVIILEKEQNDEVFIKKIEELALKCDGLFVRLSKPIDDAMYHALTEAMSQTQLLLLDYDFTKIQMDLLINSSSKKPIDYGFVGVNSEKSGALISDSIKRLTKGSHNNGKSCCLVLLDLQLLTDYEYGEKGNMELRYSETIDRLKNISEDETPDSTIYLPHYYNNAVANIETLYKNINTKLVENRVLRENTELILFCGSDIVARKLMEYNELNPPTDTDCVGTSLRICKETVFIGHDGIKDYDQEYIVDFLKYKWITVDVQPYEQGKLTIEFMYDMVKKPRNDRRRVKNFTEKVAKHMGTKCARSLKDICIPCAPDKSTQQ